MERILVLVDEANITSSARSLNKRLDWNLLRKFIIGDETSRKVIEFIIYIGLPPEMPEYQDQRSKKLKYVYWLRTNGFLVVTKDGSPGMGGYKANVDVMMGVDGVLMASEMKPDTIVLVTGDSDFSYLASTLRRKGICVQVAALSQSLGNELKSVANNIIDLKGLFNSFEQWNEFSTGLANL